MEKNSSIVVLGSRGLVGSALIRELQSQGYKYITAHERSDANLTDPVETKWFFSCYQPEYVFFCAARVGGIKDNIANPLSFFLDNMKIEMNVLENAAEYGVKKLVFLGSSCIYPRDCPQPIKEEYLLTGPYEKAVEAYGLAKTCGVKLCQWFRQEKGCNFVSAMPCNIFGPGDNFDPQTAHVVPGMMARMHEAKIRNDSGFKVWGNPDTKRELLYSDDLARALITVMQKYDGPEPINAGSGIELDMFYIANAIADVIGYTGRLDFDPEAPIGTPRKLMDNRKIYGLGWNPLFFFETALKLTYESFLA